MRKNYSDLTENLLCFLNHCIFMEIEQLQEDCNTLLDWILKLCPRDHQIIPLILFAADFVPFLSRLISDVGKGKMQVKQKTLNSEEITFTAG